MVTRSHLRLVVSTAPNPAPKPLSLERQPDDFTSYEIRLTLGIKAAVWRRYRASFGQRLRKLYEQATRQQPSFFDSPYGMAQYCYPRSFWDAAMRLGREYFRDLPANR